MAGLQRHSGKPHVSARSAEGEIELFREPSHKANGNTLDRQGRLVTCEHATSRVTRAEPNGSDDGACHAPSGQGSSTARTTSSSPPAASIYFTDPGYGRMEFYGVPRRQELSFQGVYRIDGDGARLTLLADDFVQPNGLCFSLDESRLFVNDTERGHIRRVRRRAERRPQRRRGVGGDRRRRGRERPTA